MSGDRPVSVPLAKTGCPARTALVGGAFFPIGDAGDDDRLAGDETLVARTVMVIECGTGPRLLDAELNFFCWASTR